MKRLVLALIPVALMATASLALPDMTPEPSIQETAAIQVAQAPHTATTPGNPQVVAQNQSPDQTEVAQASEQVAQEPLPQLVVDRSPLLQALGVLLRATEQAKLAVTELDADAQQRYIQETINLLAGSDDPNFRLMAAPGTASVYTGASSLLAQALVIREAAEVQYLVALQRYLGQQQTATIAQAGPGSAPAGANTLAVSTLGTKGLRPEEQANQLLARAIQQAVDALRIASEQPEVTSREDVGLVNHASDQAAQLMESIVRMLESAMKIVQIAIDR
jgi:hypothetical protein